MIAEIAEIAKVDSELEKRAARSNLIDFIDYTKPDYIHNWHNEATANILTDWAYGRIPYLILEEPPRHGKSEQASRRLPAFLFGINPEEQIVGASYSADLANKMNIDVQRIIDSPLYSELFPNTNLGGMNENKAGKWKRTQNYFEIIDTKGSYRSSGVGGGITGMGLTKGIIDDYCKNKEEADSEVYRDKVWNWYLSTFFTRLEKYASILITATRWHEDDLIGRILESEHGDRWQVVKLKAIREDDDNELDPRKEGEALWPDKYPIEKLQEIKTAIGSRNFASLYQQAPSVAEGTIFKRDWFKFYKEIPLSLRGFKLQSWDTDFGKNAATSAGISGVLIENGVYITGLFEDSLEYPQLYAQVLMEFNNMNPHAVLIEDKASGQSLIQQLQQQTNVPVIPINPTTDKESRAHSESPYVEAGNVYIPEDAPWAKRLIDVLCAFPDIKRKDIVDAFTQLIKYCRETPAGKITVTHKPRKTRMVQGF